jgi:EmrB/QacA subfamily drug resistance transporter
MAGLMLAIFVAAMDSTVVGTALPTVAHQLGDFSLYPWVFSGYLLTATTTVPIWGRLADLFGRRRVLLAGLGIFVVASVLCGLSPSMPALIVFRTLQGVGAGCLQPLIFTIVSDLFPVAQRARLQGFFSAMWAIASLIGPTIGAVFVSTIGWRWIFGINLPIGLVAGALLWGYRERRPEGRRQRVEVLGALMLTAGVGVLLWGVGTGSSNARPIWPAAAAGVALLTAFVLRERRSESPTVPLDLLGRRLIALAIATTMVAGTVMFSITAYVPLYVQNGLGGSPYAAGAAAAPIAFGWPVGSVLAGQLLLKVGFWRLVIAGASALVGGCAMLATIAHSALSAGVSVAVIGLGMGLLSLPLLLVIQGAADWSRRGAATALNQFSRTIGGAVGVSLLGVLLEARVGTGATGAHLVAGVQTIFAVTLGLAVVTLVLTLAMLAGRRNQPEPF